MARRSRYQDEVKSLGSRVYAARRSRGLTQAQLAKAIGIDRTAVVRIEAGARPPQFRQLLALHDALGIERGSLLRA